MALRPPTDFAPPLTKPAAPSEAELRVLWHRHEANRRERERAGEWRALLEQTRRDGDDQVRPALSAGDLPAYVSDGRAVGAEARGALRPVSRRGRVLGAGVDTWSPCWYAAPGSPLARAMAALATHRTRLAWLLPDPVAGYRVGWFAEPGLVFAEGRPGGAALCSAADLPSAGAVLDRSLEDLGIPIGSVPSAGLRRLDIAADLRPDSAPEGLALLECVAGASLGSGKLAIYRAERCVESVLIKSRCGRTLGRLYDKGAQTRAAPRGQWLRFEAQWRLARGARLDCAEIDAALLRERFRSRFEALWQASGGSRLGGLVSVGERIQAAVATGQLAPSRARSIAGYLVLAATGIPQGAKRTTYELERECRQLGLTVSLLRGEERRVDVATVLDECLAPQVWH